MPTARVPWGAALNDLLADGEWHDREEVLSVMVAAVPPGVAYRHGEHRRLLQSSSGGPRVSGDDATAIAAGARDRARNVLNTRVKTGTIERDGDRFRKAGNGGNRTP